MPRTKEEASIYAKKHYQLNKEKRKQQSKELYQLNKEKRKQQYNQRYLLNKEERKQQMIEYSQTESGIKSNRISSWKRQGMILPEGETWDSIYRKYLHCTNCEQCNKVFKNSLDRQLDHCHTTGFIRNIVCCRCNTLRRYEDAKTNC